MNEETIKIIVANTSPRYRRLEGLERWVEGTQYDGKPDWFMGEDVPRWERAPCIVYPIVAIAIDSNVDLVFGEGRFPTFTSRQGDDETEGADKADPEASPPEPEEGALTEEQSGTLDRFIVEYHKRSKFKTHAREAFAHGQGTGTACAVHGARNGVPFAELIPAKTATPEFNVDGAVVSVDVRYPYVEEYLEHGVWKERVKLYRRKIDEKSDTTYLPADAAPDGREPEWRADQSRTLVHGFEFCPVVWYPFMKGCVPVNVYDGRAIHRNLRDEIQQHDIAVSSRHTCALLAEPQITEIGVSPGHNPTETGRPVGILSSSKPGEDAVDALTQGRVTGMYASPGGGKARKKGPGYVWQYPSPETKVGYLTITADVLKAQDDNAKDIMFKVQDGLGVVFVDPQNMKFASTTSGKALEAIKQKQIDRCDQYRDDLWDHFLLPSLSMQLRIAQTLGTRLKVRGVAKAAPLLGAAQKAVDEQRPIRAA